MDTPGASFHTEWDDHAIKTVGELECFGVVVSSQASLRVADIHKISGDKAK